MTVRITWDQVRAWRMRRQLLDPPADVDAVDIARRLCGIQAQVASAAEQAVALRQAAPRPGDVATALADHRLVRTWAMRGTLHLLPADQVGSFLSLMAAGRSWERPGWVKAFGVSPDQMAALGDVVAEILDGVELTREAMLAEVVARTGRVDLEQQLRSGWGAVLKPLSWQGVICNGSPQGNRVTFTRLDQWVAGWRGLPEADEAAAAALPAYLGAYGPATIDRFDRFMTRGLFRKPVLRGWFDALGDRLVTVEVEGEPRFVLADDVDELAAIKPTKRVRLLPAFDQYVLGPSTDAVEIVTAARRKEVSRAAGWIAPVVVAAGRVAGVWELEDARVAVRWFEESGRVNRRALAAEVARLAAVLDSDLELNLEIVAP